MIKHNHISITGGGGHLGTCLIQILLNKGKIIKALYRNLIPNIHHQNLIWIKGDIIDAKSLNELLNGSSVIIHCASLISLGDQQNDEVYSTNVHGTEAIIEACLHREIRLIYISSSVAVLETKPNEVFNEIRPYKTKDDFIYSYTKALAEQRVLTAVKNKNLDAVIIRPTAIVGPPDFKPSHFGQTILDITHQKFPIITDGGYNVVDIRDLSATIIKSIFKGKQGEVYLVGGEYISLKELAQIANPNRTFIAIPLNFLIGILPLINFYKSIFSLRWPISKESLDMLKHAPIKMDCSKAINHLDHKNRPLDKTITDLIAWFKIENE